MERTVPMTSYADGSKSFTNGCAMKKFTTQGDIMVTELNYWVSKKYII